MTELIGDIVLTCTGGIPLAPGSPIPTANVTVSLAANVTNRIIGAGNVVEALLLIDEPGSGLPGVVPGFGPQAPQIPCVAGDGLAVGAGPGGCAEFAGSGSIPTAVFAPGSVRPAPNMFLGTVSGNQVVFNGIPILPPVGTTRVFRITNIRANVSALTGSMPGPQPVLASVAISGNNTVPVSNPVLVTGFVKTGLSTAVRNADNTDSLASGGVAFSQCGSVAMSPVAILQFSELFGTAFETRVAPTSTTNGQASVQQNVPGQIFNSESGFVTLGFGTLVSGGNPIGLADFGTRVKAVFHNLSPGIHLFVSVANLVAGTSSATISKPSQTSAGSFARLVSGEAVPDGNGTVASVNPTAALNGSPGITDIAEIPVVNGSATAVWEVINTNPAAQETLLFGVWISYSADPTSGIPPPGAATVNLSYAPTPGPQTFGTGEASAASPTLSVIRFIDTPGTGSGLLAIGVCQTLLLFPYVTNQAGFDTGIAIANTSKDPFDTKPQSGSCALSWYDGKSHPSTNTGSIPAGTVYTASASSLLPDGFTGYVIARCGFQLAHGFAAIGDAGIRNLAVEYLALIISTNAQGNRNLTGSAEVLAH